MINKLSIPSINEDVNEDYDYFINGIKDENVFFFLIFNI